MTPEEELAILKADATTRRADEIRNAKLIMCFWCFLLMREFRSCLLRGEVVMPLIYVAFFCLMLAVLITWDERR